MLNKIVGCVLFGAFVFGPYCWANVAVSDLPELTVDTAGVSTPFSSGVWGNPSDISELTKQIESVGQLKLTRAQLDVFRQLLLTDVSGSDAFTKADGSFLKTRLKALSEQGLFEDVLTLINQIPEPQKTDEMKRFKAEALFALGRFSEACADGLIAAFPSSEAAFIQVACTRETGTNAEATLAFDVYREGNEETFAFGAVSGDRVYRKLSPNLPNEGTPSVWELPLVAQAFGRTVLERPLSRGKLRALALNEKTPPAVRVEAAEQAYLSVADWKSVLAQPIAFGDKDVGAIKRAGLYQEALATKKEATLEKAVRAYLKQAARDGVLLSVSPTAMELVYRLNASEKTVDMASEVIRVSALNGELTTAAKWYELLTEKNQVAALRLAVLMNMMGAGVPDTIDPLIEGCIRDKTCDVDLKGIPFFFPISPDKAVQVPSGISVGYPGFVTASVQEQIERGEVGVGLLNGLMLLAQSSDPERPLISVMGRVLPKGMADALLMERLAY